MKTYINGNCIEQIITNAVTLTQQEYDALPSTEKNHGTYIISDADSPDIPASEIVYSDMDLLGTGGDTEGNWTNASVLNLSNYSLLFYTMLSNSGGFLNPVVIPYASFKKQNNSNKLLTIRLMMNTTTFHEIDIYYKTDTTVQVYCTNGINWALYGIK